MPASPSDSPTDDSASRLCEGLPRRLACVIPFFDGSATIARALDSVLSSDVCDEVIVVADGRDQDVRRGLAPAHLAAEHGGRLHLLELSSNVGPGGARNLGAALARAELISFLDQDDELVAGFHLAAVERLDQHPDLAAVEGGAVVLSRGMPMIPDTDPRHRLILDSVPWNLVVRRAAFWAVGGFPSDSAFRTAAAGEDIAFKTALKSCFSVSRVATVAVHHHVRPGSATDRFIARTEVRGDQVHFLHRLAAEEDGRLARAMAAHLHRARVSSAALSRMAERRNP